MKDNVLADHSPVELNRSQRPDILSGKSIALIAPTSHRADLVQSLAKALAAQKFNVEVVSESNFNSKTHDILILLGSVGSLRQTISNLRSRSKRSTCVVVWGNEPLPPIEMEPWAVKLGIRFSLTSLRALKSKPVWHFLNYPIYAIISRFGLGKYSLGNSTNRIKSSFARFTFDNLGLLSIGTSEKWIDLIGVSTIQRQNMLRKLGIRSAFLPVGQQQSFGKDLGLRRDIDVIFVGRISKNPQRALRMTHLIKSLENLDFNVKVYTKGLYGEERTRVLNRSRIIVNLLNFQWDTPWMRWLLADANGALMVSEPLTTPEPFIPGEHYLSGSMEELPEMIKHILSNEDERLQLVKNCRDRIDETMTLDISVNRLLSELRSCFLNRDQNV